jgi:hypothetical protein
MVNGADFPILLQVVQYEEHRLAGQKANQPALW